MSLSDNVAAPVTVQLGTLYPQANNLRLHAYRQKHMGKHQADGVPADASCVKCYIAGKVGYGAGAGGGEDRRGAQGGEGVAQSSASAHPRLTSNTSSAAS